MATTPRVVVGLPVYNGRKYIGAAIESHLSQSFGDFLLVISDNASTDDTPDICESYAAKDARVKVWRSPQNRGILWNHRRVMEAMEGAGPYFRWAGADDILEPGLLQLYVDTLDRDPDVSAVMPNTKNIDEDGAITGTMARSLDLQSSSVSQRAWDLLLARFQHVVAYGLMRSDMLRAMRTGPHYFGWDEIFIWELALRGKIVQPDGPALLRRFHRGSISRVKTVKELRKWVEPNAKAGMSFPHWNWAWERMRVLLATPMPAGERMRIASRLLRHTAWQRQDLARDVTQATKRALGLSDKYTF